MPEETNGSPGWVDQRLDEIFAALPGGPAVQAARDAYATCLGRAKSPSSPSDNLGVEFTGCRAALQRGLMLAGVGDDVVAKLIPAIEELEAETAEES